MPVEENALPQFFAWRILIRDTSTMLSAFWGVIVLGIFFFVEYSAQQLNQQAPLSAARFIVAGYGAFLILRTQLRVIRLVRLLRTGKPCDGVILDIQIEAPNPLNRFGSYLVFYQFDFNGKMLQNNHSVLSTLCSPGSRVTVCVDPLKPSRNIVRDLFVSPVRASQNSVSASSQILEGDYFRKSPMGGRFKSSFLNRDGEVCFDVELKEDRLPIQSLIAIVLLVGGIGLCYFANQHQWNQPLRDIASFAGLLGATAGPVLAYYLLQKPPRHLLSRNGAKFLHVDSTQRGSYRVMDDSGVCLAELPTVSPHAIKIVIAGDAVALLHWTPATTGSEPCLAQIDLIEDGLTVAKMTNGWFPELLINPEGAAKIDIRLILAAWQLFRWSR